VVPSSTGLPVPAITLSERFLELTTDIAGALAFDGRLVGANPALTRLVGAEIGELAGPRAVELMHPDDRAALGALWAELVGGARETAELEVRLGRGDARRWFLLSIAIDRDASLVYIIGKEDRKSVV